MNNSFKIGDRVTFVNQKGYGRVKSINNEKITIITNDGFEIPFPPDELIITNSANYEKLSVSDSDAMIKKLGELKKNNTLKNKSRNSIPEIDLHIECLLEKWEHMSNHELINFQIRALRTQLEKWFRAGIQRAVIIHGKGEGVLRSAVREELLKHNEIEFLDASYLKYSTGATEIIIKRRIK